MSQISQKEYLKKYLNIGRAPGEKKKKKKPKSGPNRLKIIDDNLDTYTQAVQEDLLGETEDAPQIVAVIDERPHSIQTDDKTNSNLWVPIKNLANDEALNSNVQLKSSFRIGYNSKNDHSPPRKRKDHIKNTERDSSPSRKPNTDFFGNEKKYLKSPDMSPPRKSRNNDNFSPKHNSSKQSNDYSPPRKRALPEKDESPPRRSRSEFSPKHKFPKQSDDYSPPRKKALPVKDRSPPRRYKSDFSPKYKSPKQSDDYSPPRRKSTQERDKSLSKRYIADFSPKRKSSKLNDDFSSPKSKRVLSCERTNSPPRRSNTYHIKLNKKNSDKDIKSSNKIQKSPDRNTFSKVKESLPKNNQSEDHSPLRKQSKATKTLDGKKAGLQSAKELFSETMELKQREEALFNNLSSEISGRNASTIVRDRKTGKMRNFAEEAEKNYEKQIKQQENEEKYTRWGRGLKQIEDANDKIAEELKEMSKPLARYADDEDLDKYLKEQEREGDPMLAYIRKKKKKLVVEEGKPVKPEYMGEFMPNRFGIRPGYRWDGVDRSSGYEKKWFEIQNAKTAQKEESYKWSTEDM